MDINWTSKTDAYANLLNSALNLSVNKTILDWEKILLDSWDWSFDTWDLYYGIHLYKWRAYLYKIQGEKYIIIEFEDTYDFAETKYTTETSDFLNHMWYHYQERLDWNKYTWISENYYKINQ